MIARTFELVFWCLSIVALVACAGPRVETEEPAAVPDTPPPAAAPGQSSSGITEGELGQQGPTVTGQGSLEALKDGTAPKAGVLADVYFEFDRSELVSEARDVLQRNTDWIKAHPGVRIEIEGHADNRGANEYNLALGSRRAQAVKDYLITLGVTRDRVSTISYGEELPVCGENTEECWRLNRRAHFVVLAQGPAS